MTISQKRTVITLGLFAGILAVAFLLLSLARVGYAHADGSGGSAVALVVDAGVPSVATGPGSATTVTTTTNTTPAGVTSTTSISVPDPVTNPLAFIAALKALWSINWGLAIGAAALALAELLALAGKKFAFLAFFGKGRISVVLAGAVAILSTGIASVTGANAWGWLPFLSAIGAAALAFWHNAGTDPAKA